MNDRSETAWAKLNLALHVRERLPDDYHRIETIFAFCEGGDQLSAEPSDSISLTLSGEFSEGLSDSDNIAAKAATALQQASGTAAGAALHLKKVLPVAAGLGGGSADAAAVLRLLNNLWGLEWPAERLEDIARELGADVPACLYSRASRGDGKGDELQALDLGISGTPVLLINPREALPTAEVFARWDGVDRGALSDWKDGRNDLEPAATSFAPQIGGILAWLSAQPGSQHVRMSGSGATCFAIFQTEEQRDHAAEGVPREWWRLATRLR